MRWAQAHFFVGAGLPVGGATGRSTDGESTRILRMIVDLEKIEAIAERVAASEGLTLIDVELKGGMSNPLLRVYIDKPGGVTHADCALVSEQLSAILDVEDPFPGSYLLEVSSPGLDRKLVKPREYRYFTGRRARIVLREAIEEKKVFEGRLVGFNEGRVQLGLDNQKIAEFELSNISKARLLPEL
ncbi:MAG TPA: ribosome maturation factor RimP [Terriglobia bacterium]|nr:ribosome maturation factor RimP [Terriglobia bacterium]